MAVALTDRFWALRARSICSATSPKAIRFTSILWLVA